MWPPALSFKSALQTEESLKGDFSREFIDSAGCYQIICTSLELLLEQMSDSFAEEHLGKMGIGEQTWCSRASKAKSVYDVYTRRNISRGRGE